MRTRASIASWVEELGQQSSPPNVLQSAPLSTLANKENQHASTSPQDPKLSSRKRPRLAAMATASTDPNITPRQSKRRAIDYDLTSPYPSFSASESSASITSEIESHKSGRMSPSKQMALLEDLQQPVRFKDFETHEATIPSDVEELRRDTQKLADGVVTDDEDSKEQDLAEIPALVNERELPRFQYQWANDLSSRLELGTPPPLNSVTGIVRAGIICEQRRAHEFVWNEDVHSGLVKLALETSTNALTLQLQSLKTAAIEPRSLGEATLPKRVVDYGIVLIPDSKIRDAWESLIPLPDAGIKSWNHTTLATVREMPIAVNFETKAPDKSWTDGKPQIAIWVDALFNRLSRLEYSDAVQKPHAPMPPAPAMPLVIAQGHDWHLLILSRRCLPPDQKSRMIIWQKIDIGSTRNCFDAYKLIAVLHLLFQWAETVWRPFIHKLLPL